MKFIMQCYIFLIVLFLGGATAWSIPNKDVLHLWGNSVIKVTGPADGGMNQYRIVFTVNGGNQLRACNNRSLNYSLSKVLYEPIAIPTGERSLTGQKGEYFETGVDGLIMLIQMSSASGITPTGMNASPLPSKPFVIWSGWQPNSIRVNGFTWFPTITMVKGKNRIEHGTVIPRQPLYTLTCFDPNGIAREMNTVYLDEITVESTVTTCAPDANIKTINMAGVPISNIENASFSTLISTKQQTFGLKCDPNINLHFSIVDLNDPTNRTSTSTLTSDSTASGVGYAITSANGTRLKFGPDGSALGIPDQEKYFIGVSGNVDGKNNPMTLTLGFSYIRKAEESIKAGTAKSLIGITYSYQ